MPNPRFTEQFFLDNTQSHNNLASGPMLNLYATEATDDEMPAVAAFLAKHPEIKGLHLQGCNISERGVDCLGEMAGELNITGVKYSYSADRIRAVRESQTFAAMETRRATERFAQQQERTTRIEELTNVALGAYQTYTQDRTTSMQDLLRTAFTTYCDKQAATKGLAKT